MTSRNYSDPECGMRNAEHGTHNPLVALPHLRFRVTAIKTKWEGDIHDQQKLLRPGTRNPYPLVALPHLRFRVTAIKTKWEGDYP
jgi:hypothetical protein